MEKKAIYYVILTLTMAQVKNMLRIYTEGKTQNKLADDISIIE